MLTFKNKTIPLMLMSAGFFVSSLFLYSAVETKEGSPNPNDIQVVPVDRTPAPDDVELRLQYPNYGYVEKKDTVHVEMRLDWFPLGVDSEFPRKKEIYSNDEGQTIHIFIDDHDYFEINEALFDAVDDHDDYFDQIAEFEIPFSLKPGVHIIRAFPCRSYGESLKEGKSYMDSVFYFQKKEGVPFDLKKPYLTYNTPQGTYQDESKPILLDFYIKNCALSKDGYKVRVTIDGENQRFLYEWNPYYIYGLKKGAHKIRLELINPQNNLVEGSFNNVEKTFFIE